MNLKIFSVRFIAILLSVCWMRPVFARATCERAQLSDPPQWISTVELNEKTGEILIADPKEGKLLAFDIRTKKMAPVRFSTDIFPAVVTKIQDGFLVKSVDRTVIIPQGEKLLSGKSPAIRMPKVASPVGLETLYANWVTRGSTFVGFGVVNSTDLAPSQYHPGRAFQLGLVRGKVNSVSGQFRDIELLMATEDNNWYLIGFPYFATTDDAIYYVRMTGTEAAIVRVNETGPAAITELRMFPDGFRSVPRLKTPNKGPSTTAARFKEIEQARMVVGLFGQGKMLYLLAREPNPSGDGTQWLLFQIDPIKGKLEDPLRLPTTANHLAVIPGPEYWYLIERGAVKGWGDQANETIIRISKNLITSPVGSRLSLNDPPVQCEEWKAK